MAIKKETVKTSKTTAAPVRNVASKSAERLVNENKTPEAPLVYEMSATEAAPVVASTPQPTATLANRVSAEERYRMVAEAAYYEAEKNGFKSDPAANWFKAERIVEELL